MAVINENNSKIPGIHLFRCTWDDDWYGKSKEFIFALDEQHARDIVEERFNGNKTVRNLSVNEVTIRPVRCVPRQTHMLIQGSTRPVTFFYCSYCNNEVMPYNDFCDNCGGYFEKGDKCYHE